MGMVLLSRDFTIIFSLLTLFHMQEENQCHAFRIYSIIASEKLIRYQIRHATFTGSLQISLLIGTHILTRVPYAQVSQHFQELYAKDISWREYSFMLSGSNHPCFIIPS